MIYLRTPNLNCSTYSSASGWISTRTFIVSAFLEIGQKLGYRATHSRACLFQTSQNGLMQFFLILFFYVVILIANLFFQNKAHVIILNRRKADHLPAKGLSKPKKPRRVPLGTIVHATQIGSSRGDFELPICEGLHRELRSFISLSKDRISATLHSTPNSCTRSRRTGRRD